MASSSGARTKLPRAIRDLCNHGIEALKPQLIHNSKTRNATHWNPPMVTNRDCNWIRKKAIVSGTYGSFDSTTGVGWDPAWDLEMATRGGGTGRFRIRPKKKTSRERTREERAQKIEKNMEDMDEEIAKYHLEKAQQKPVKNWDSYYKSHGKQLR